MAQLGFVCLIALAEARPIDLLPVRAALHRFAPDVPLSIERGPKAADETALRITHDGHLFAVHLAPGRLPEAEYQAAVTGNLLWPAAADAVARHRGCLTVAGSKAPEDPREARLQAAAITRLAAALSEATGGLGLHWVGSEAMTAPERLAAAPDEIARGEWPTDIWLGYAVFGATGDSGPLVLGVRTRGGLPFFGCELDLPPMPAQGMLAPVRRLAGIARTLVGRDMTVLDGETLEAGAGSERALYRAARVETGTGAPPVCRLTPL